VPGRVAAELPPQARGQLAGFAEPLLGSQRNELPGRVRAEQVGEDPLRLVRVVHEQEQIAQTEQDIRTGGCGRQGTGPAVHVADHVNPHEQRLSRSQLTRPGAG